MMSQNLDNLVSTGQIKREPPDQTEYDGLVRSGRTRLNDAQNVSLSIESRFDLAYNAAHSLALAALRRHGYRSENRYIVFQCLPHTLGVEPSTWRLLVHCHGLRNRGEYEGMFDIERQIVDDLIEATQKVLESLEKLGPVP